MVAVLLKTLRTIGKPYFWTMLLLSLVVTAVTFGLLFVAVGYLLGATAFVSIGWLDTILDWTTGLGTGILAWFLFPALLPLVASLFLEQISGRIERREYDLAPPPSLPFWPEAIGGLKFAGLSLLLNLLALPLYLIPVLFPFIYYGLNSYLLGRGVFRNGGGAPYGTKGGASSPTGASAKRPAFRIDHGDCRHAAVCRPLRAVYRRCFIRASCPVRDDDAKQSPAVGGGILTLP